MDVPADILQHRLREGQASKRGSDGVEEQFRNKKRRAPDYKANVGSAAVGWDMREPQGNRGTSDQGWLGGGGTTHDPHTR